MATATLISRAELVQRLKALEPQLRARGVTSLAMFGSRARGDARPDSDLDLLIEVADNERFSLLRLVGVERIVGEQLALEAIALVRPDLQADFVERIQDDLMEIF